YDVLANFASKIEGESEAKIYLDSRLYHSKAWPEYVYAFSYGEHAFSDFGAVAARPGMGLITDCITSGVPLFCISIDNVEMRHNATILEELGLGKVQREELNILSDMLKLTRNDDSIARYRNKVSE